MSEGSSVPRAGRLRRAFRPERAGWLFVALAALLLVVVVDQVAQGASADDTESRFRVATTAGGNVTLFLLAVMVTIGFVLSHPTSERTFRLSQCLVPWPRDCGSSSRPFGLLHVASVLLVPFRRVTIAGALVPGLSNYRTWANTLGTLTMYPFLVTYLTARYASRLPPGRWLTIHRVSVIVFVLAWFHVRSISSDTSGFEWLYVGTALAVGCSAAYRLWASRRGRPPYAGWVREAVVAEPPRAGAPLPDAPLVEATEG